MKQVVKPTTVELVLVTLRKQITSGRWPARLPGTRTLAKYLGVSPPTVTAALKQLSKEGLLISGGERRAYRVNRSKAVVKKSGLPVQLKHLLILTNREIGTMVDVSRRLIEQLAARMSAKGWEISYLTVDYFHAKQPRKSWDQLIQMEPGSSVVAIAGNQALAMWALKRNLRIMFLGGAVDDLPVHLLGVSMQQVTATALRHLAELGHSRIILPLCARNPSVTKRLSETTRHAIESTGQTYIKSYHNPSSDVQDADVIWQLLEKTFAVKPPTALVFLDWRELLTAQCFIQQAGFKIPEDISLILLTDHVEAEWFRPQLSRFQFPLRRVLNAVNRWLEHDSGTAETKELPGELVKGKTIASPATQT